MGAKSYIYLLLLFTPLVAQADFFNRSDSGIKGPPYQSILSWTEKLQKAYPNLVTNFDYGKSVQGRTLRLMYVKNATASISNRSAIIMTGSTHGNEYLNIEDRLPEELLKRSNLSGPVKDYLDSGGVFVFVPILNPDGYENRKRRNANNVDLNRDWDVPPANHKGFKEIETRLLAKKLDEFRAKDQLEIKLTVDYHCCAGALLTPWSYTKKDLPEPALSIHHEIGDIADSHLNLEVGATGQVLGYYPMGTTKDYYFSKYGAIAYTYEGRYGSEDKKLAQHVSWWVEMIDYVTKNLSRATPYISLLNPLLSSINPTF